MHLVNVRLRPQDYPRKDVYPFNLSIFQQTESLNFMQPVTFFIGENGTGKSTLLRAMCQKCGIHIWEDTERGRFKNNPFENDLEKYLGKWYEIAHLPARFQEGCSETTATYALMDNGTISVLNECKINGKIKKAKGKAKVVDKATGAKLKVTFFWPFYGDYWILRLGNNYEYSVVGTPDRKYLWILSRTPQINSELLSELIDFAKSKGFETSKLIKTSQP